MTFWDDCMLVAAHIINKLPTPLLNNLSPYEKLFNKPPNINHMKTIGCLCYASTLSFDKHKFAPRAIKCIFLGYPFSQKGYLVYDLEKEKTFVSRDVVFDETIFPFQENSLEPQNFV